MVDLKATLSIYQTVIFEYQRLLLLPCHWLFGPKKHRLAIAVAFENSTKYSGALPLHWIVASFLSLLPLFLEILEPLHIVAIIIVAVIGFVEDAHGRSSAHCFAEFEEVELLIWPQFFGQFCWYLSHLYRVLIPSQQVLGSIYPWRIHATGDTEFVFFTARVFRRVQRHHQLLDKPSCLHVLQINCPSDVWLLQHPEGSIWCLSHTNPEGWAEVMGMGTIVICEIFLPLHCSWTHFAF